MRRYFCSAVLLAIGFAVGLTPGAARAQMISSREGIALQNQIFALRQEVQALQQNQGGNGGSVLGRSQPEGSGPGTAGGALLPTMVQQVQQLQDEVQSLRGRVDNLEHEVATQNDQINKEIGDLKFQMGQGGTGGSSGPPSLSGPQQGGPHTLGQLPAAPAPPAAAPPPRPPAKITASLAAARHALAAHDYKTAEADAKALISHQGKGADNGAAELVLAQALDGQHRFQESALAYDDAYNADKSGPHAADALLGLSNSLAEIGQDNAACDTLDSLISQFSSPSPSLAARVHAIRLKAHCH